ncbi:MAG: biopolymer transporter ExbD [Fusobacteriaceae bacterium]|nr:biopolymer transporter ExbD [Fusobacteriaceae bacterium]MBP6322970.1 biopolymer transporter ExbD [Fusobacteriaceae bacterium]MBP9510318.1 biopolymer transporter ExbD [Fusobacteriaceae bacterium]
MRLNRMKRRSGGELILEITPLIDVVFLLLIFFLVATSFEDTKSGIKIDLPTSTIKELKEVKEIQVVIDKNMQLSLNFKDKGQQKQEKVTLGTLREVLSNKLKNSAEKNVMISADKTLDYGLIVNVMTIAKEAGASSLDIDTSSLSPSNK